MSFTLFIRQEASVETIDAYLWYEEKLAGLGEHFLSSLDETYSDIASRPTSFQIKYGAFRHALVRGFPFVVFFSEDDNTVTVFSVFHTSRRPKS